MALEAPQFALSGDFLYFLFLETNHADNGERRLSLFLFLGTNHADSGERRFGFFLYLETVNNHVDSGECDGTYRINGAG